MINDVNALQAAGAIDLLASYDHVSICLMHKKGLPSTMQDKPFYDNVILEVRRFLEARIDACYKKGIDRSRLIVDPGIGFGKRLEDNMRCLKDLQEFKQLLCPILVGVSRKSMFDQLLGLPVSKRLLPSVVTAFYALQQGANIIRVHDVRETHQALKLCQALC